MGRLRVLFREFSIIVFNISFCIRAVGLWPCVADQACSEQTGDIFIFYIISISIHPYFNGNGEL